MNNSFAALTSPVIHDDLIQFQDRVPQQIFAMAKAMVSLIGFRDHYTASHSARVTTYVHNVAAQLALPDDEKEVVVFAASLHDIGKAGVPDDILLKPDKLNEKELA